MMICLIVLIVLIASPVITKPRYVELDDDEHELFRAAYDTPSYDHDDHKEDEDMNLGKLDLLKDGFWMLKAKINELKAFNKAFAANLLSTKLKLKELIANQLAHKKHEIQEKKKPIHNYQPPSFTYEPQGQQYGHDPYYGL